MADGSAERIAVEAGVLLQRIRDPGGDQGAGAVVRLGKQDGELVAADAREDGVVGKRGGDRRRDRLEELVAEVVAALVVRLLQPVGVDHDHAAVRVGLERLFPGATVRELRQGVDARVAADLVELRLEVVQGQRGAQ